MQVGKQVQDLCRPEGQVVNSHVRKGVDHELKMILRREVPTVSDVNVGPLGL